MAQGNEPEYCVVRNAEEQYSIWIVARELPPGWSRTGFLGPKSDCLTHIRDVWDDMRPLSVRRQMDEPVAD